MERDLRQRKIGSRLPETDLFGLGACACACLASLLANTPAYAQDGEALPPPPPPPAILETGGLLPPSPPTEVSYAPPVLPSHLSIGDQQFDWSVGGLRDYLDGIKPANAQLYAGLDPDLRRLESKRDTAVTVLTVGAIAGALSFVLAFATRTDCQSPSITDPSFAAKSEAWGACNDDNLTRTALFGFLGLGAVIAGGFGAAAAAPSRGDLLEFVNKHNRLSPQPLQLQLGYNPSSHCAYSGATLAF